MHIKIITVIFVFGVLSSCVHTSSYYTSLDKTTYAKGEAKFSDYTLNEKIQYGSLVLREDGACSIAETVTSRIIRGGGAWRETDQPDIISIRLSSSSPMTVYHFYVRLNEETNSYVVSDKMEKLIEM